MSKTLGNRIKKTVAVLIVLGVTGLLASHWTIALLHRIRAGPPGEFTAYTQTKSGLSLIGYAVSHQPGAFQLRSFPKLAEALTNAGLLSSETTNSVLAEGSNPFPGILPKGDYFRTLELPAGFEPSKVPLLWKPLHYADADRVLYIWWSGGDAELVEAKDFHVILDGLVSRGFSSNLITIKE